MGAMTGRQPMAPGVWQSRHPGQVPVGWAQRHQMGGQMTPAMQHGGGLPVPGGSMAPGVPPMQGGAMGLGGGANPHGQIAQMLGQPSQAAQRGAAIGSIGQVRQPKLGHLLAPLGGALGRMF